MILDIMDKMSMMLYGNVWIAFVGSFLWGVSSVVLSPCHLSSIPLVMGFVAKESQGAQSRALLLSMVFTLGIMVAMLVLGLSTVALGRLLGDVGSWSNWLGAAIFLLVGLLLLDVIHLPSVSMDQSRFRKGGYLAALMLGVLFGTVLGPCAFAFLMPVLGIVFASASDQPWFASGLISAYAFGHGFVIVMAGSASVWVMEILQRKSCSRWIGITRRLAGVLCLALAGWFLLR